MRKRKWSYPKRLALYREIVRVFGPYSTWGNKYFPAERKDEFEEFCRNFSIAFAMKPGGAYMQVKWAISDQKNVKLSHIITHYGNKIAAMEAGFILRKNLPKKLSCEY